MDSDSKCAPKLVGACELVALSLLPLARSMDIVMAVAGCRWKEGGTDSAQRDNEALIAGDWCTYAWAFLHPEASSENKDLAVGRTKKLFRIRAVEACCC